MYIYIVRVCVCVYIARMRRDSANKSAKLSHSFSLWVSSGAKVDD